MYPQNPYYYSQPAQNIYAQYQQAAQTTNQVPSLKGRPVASFEEARATTIDFDGSTFFFPDLANKRIYTKQINLDGTASLYVYELRETPTETSAATDVSYITREEFDKVIAEIRSMLTSSGPKAPASAAAAEISKMF